MVGALVEAAGDDGAYEAGAVEGEGEAAAVHGIVGEGEAVSLFDGLAGEFEVEAHGVGGAAETGDDVALAANPVCLASRSAVGGREEESSSGELDLKGHGGVAFFGVGMEAAAEEPGSLGAEGVKAQEALLLGDDLKVALDRCVCAHGDAPFASSYPGWVKLDAPVPRFSNPRRTWGRVRSRRVQLGTTDGRSRAGGNLLRRCVGMLLLVALIWTVYVVWRINRVAGEDQARAADAIAVFGAAEYRGRPSPVYHARLDHAVALYRRRVAPTVITLGGGSDKDSGMTEGGVGRDYLLANGVPYADIIAETNSFSTGQQVRRLAEIARANDLRRIVVVSDGTHLFRIQQMCMAAGLEVYPSPRARLGHIDDLDLSLRYAHEILSYTALLLHLSEGWLHRWIDGKSDD